MALSSMKKAVILAACVSVAPAIRVGEAETSKGGPPSCQQVEEDVIILAETSEGNSWVGEYRCYNGGDIMVKCGPAAGGRPKCEPASQGNDLFSEAFRRVGDIAGDVVDGIGGLFGGMEKPDPKQRLMEGPSEQEMRNALNKIGDPETEREIKNAWPGLNNFERDIVIGSIMSVVSEEGPSLVETGEKKVAVKSDNEGQAKSEALTEVHAHVVVHEKEKLGWLFKLLEAILQGWRRKQARRAHAWGNSGFYDRSQVRAKYLSYCGWFGGR